MYYANGDIYSGQWRHDQRHGEGPYVFAASDARLKGEWLVRLVDSFAANTFAASSEQTKEEAEAEQAVWLGKLPWVVLSPGITNVKSCTPSTA